MNGYPNGNEQFLLHITHALCYDHKEVTDCWQIVAFFTLFCCNWVLRTITTTLMISFKNGKTKERKEGTSGRGVVREKFIFIPHVFIVQHKHGLKVIVANICELWLWRQSHSHTSKYLATLVFACFPNCSNFLCRNFHKLKWTDCTCLKFKLISFFSSGDDIDIDPIAQAAALEGDDFGQSLPASKGKKGKKKKKDDWYVGIQQLSDFFRK